MKKLWAVASIGWISLVSGSAFCAGAPLDYADGPAGMPPTPGRALRVPEFNNRDELLFGNGALGTHHAF